MEETKTQAKGFHRLAIEKFNALSEQYAGVLSASAFASAFSRAGFGMANQPSLQNSRIKAISSLPVDYTKDQIGGFLRNPYSHERELRETSEILRWTNYPYFKIIKTYADIPTDRYYFKPKYLTDDAAKTKDFEREAALLDKFNKELKPEQTLHKIRGEALLQGKAIYATRYQVDKAHNLINYAFLEQLPIDWCTIIGRNNISGWTVSFNMMYFLKPGTTVAQYGDLFQPYLEGFERMFMKKDDGRKFVYASRNNASGVTIRKGDKKVIFFPENVDPDSPGNPRVFQQNGTWAYYVSLPIDRVWAFEIDDTTPAIIPPLAGMMLTYAQQADFEEIQKTLYTNPLVKIFTGEIPYFDDQGTRAEDTYKLSDGGRILFQYLFEEMMAKNNTAGTAFYMAPVENIKSHDYQESANANDISTTFNQYAGSKAGLAALIPVDKDIKAAQVEVARLIESRYATACIYPQFERMMNWIYSTLNLKYDWEFKIFGTIFTEEQMRKDAEAEFARGDMSALFVIAALDGMSWLDKVAMLRAMDASGIMDLFRVPETAYTQSGKVSTSTGNGPGRPRTEGISSEAKEKAIDMGVSATEE